MYLLVTAIIPAIPSMHAVWTSLSENEVPDGWLCINIFPDSLKRSACQINILFLSPDVFLSIIFPEASKTTECSTGRHDIDLAVSRKSSLTPILPSILIFLISTLPVVSLAPLIKIIFTYINFNLITRTEKHDKNIMRQDYNCISSKKHF